MLEQRSLKLDLVALALLAFVLFLGLALLTYDTADPPSALVYPAHAHAANSCGRAGAWSAHILLEGLGWSAFYLLFSLATLDALLLARRPVRDPLPRVIGWLLSLVGITTLSAMLLPQISPGPAIGPGGFLGAAGRAYLEMHFARAGAYILTLSTIVGGLLLSTDYLLVQMAAKLLHWPRRARAEVDTAVLAGPAIKLGRKPKNDLDGTLPIVAEEPSIKISGKKHVEPEVEEAEDDVDDEADEAAEAEDEDAEEEETSEEPAETAAAEAAKPSMGQRLASALRVKPPRKNEREEVMQELDAASRAEDAREYQLPSLDLLLEGEEICFEEHEKDVRRKAKILEKTFLDFGFRVKVVEIETGPVIAQFEVELEAGLRLSKITSLADDLAIALRVPSVRIVAPIPGKNTVGIEVPNAERQMVRIREVIEEANGKAQKMHIPLYLGKDVSGKPLVADLASLPHLLIAGRTGTGKSVCLNSIIVSILMTRRPDEVRMLMIDPKMVEMSAYKTLPHLMHPVVTDMRKAEAILAWAVEKMEERYALLARAGVRHISGYNQLGEEELMDRLQPENDEERKNVPTNLPYIVIVADEIADLMMTAAKEVEQHIIRLAQKSRAVGIHLVLATQKPTVDVITGLIKSNLPARIAFQVASRTDSRVVLDEMGADKLLGNGDMLFLWPGTSTLLRGQGTYVSDDEINKVIACVGTSEPQFVKELVQLKPPETEGEKGKLPNRDELYAPAVDLVVREGRGSVSLLQRALGIGYGRAARLVDYMAEDGIVGHYNGSQAREVLLTVEQWEAMSGGSNSGAGPAVAVSSGPPTRSNKVSLAGSGSLNSKRSSRADEDEEEADDAFDEEDSDGSELEDAAPVDSEQEPVDEDEEDDEEEDDDETDEDDSDDGGQNGPKKYPTRRYRAESA
jgi:DNA segregation ATPase FtsK/SpoIIIE, S-DNA-T family